MFVQSIVQNLKDIERWWGERGERVGKGWREVLGCTMGIRGIRGA